MAQRRGRERAGVRSEGIATYLGGLGFPCGKSEIVEQAVGQHAPPAIVDALEMLPDETYSSMSDIMRHYRTWVTPVSPSEEQ